MKQIGLLSVLVLFAFTALWGESNPRTTAQVKKLTPTAPVVDTRQRIYVLDTGIRDFKRHSRYLCGTDQTKFLSPVKHGDSIAHLIGERIDYRRFCVISVQVFDHNTQFMADKYFKTLEKIAADHLAVAINLSQSGTEDLKRERELLGILVDRGLKVVVAAGNKSISLERGKCLTFPSCLKLDRFKDKYNFIVVTALNVGQTNSVIGFQYTTEDGTDAIYNMEGTSQAAARHTGRLFSEKENQR